MALVHSADVRLKLGVIGRSREDVERLKRGVKKKCLSHLSIDFGNR
jgi:hypothetical protein